jgi:hypothetical protein
MPRIDTRSSFDLSQTQATLPTIGTHDAAVQAFIKSMTAAIEDPNTPNQMLACLQRSIDVLGAHTRRGEPPAQCLAAAKVPLIDGCNAYLAEKLAAVDAKILPSSRALFLDLCTTGIAPLKALPLALSPELCRTWADFRVGFKGEDPAFKDSRSRFAELLGSGATIQEAAQYLGSETLRQKLPKEAQSRLELIRAKINEASSRSGPSPRGDSKDEEAVAQLRCVETLYVDLVIGLMAAPYHLKGHQADAQAFQLARKTESAAAMGMVLKLEQSEPDLAVRKRIRSGFIAAALKASDPAALMKAVTELKMDYSNDGVEGGGRLRESSGSGGRRGGKGVGSSA